MPFVIDTDDKLVLHCVNHGVMNHESSSKDGTTMKAEKSWAAIQSVRVVPHPLPVQINTTRGQVVRTFTCSVCGYIETYDADAIDPDWRSKPTY